MDEPSWVTSVLGPLGRSLDRSFGKRDKRWEDVWAYVGPPQGYIDDGDGQEGLWRDYVEFLVEVRYEGRVFYHKLVAHKDDFERSYIPDEIYKHILDDIVYQIDKHMDEHFRKE